jgi:hypothetical protein
MQLMRTRQYARATARVLTAKRWRRRDTLTSSARCAAPGVFALLSLGALTLLAATAANAHVGDAPPSPPPPPWHPSVDSSTEPWHPPAPPEQHPTPHPNPASPPGTEPHSPDSGSPDAESPDPGSHDAESPEVDLPEGAPDAGSPDDQVPAPSHSAGPPPTPQRVFPACEDDEELVDDTCVAAGSGNAEAVGAAQRISAGVLGTRKTKSHAGVRAARTAKTLPLTR